MILYLYREHIFPDYNYAQSFTHQSTHQSTTPQGPTPTSQTFHPFPEHFTEILLFRTYAAQKQGRSLPDAGTAKTEDETRRRRITVQNLFWSQ